MFLAFLKIRVGDFFFPRSEKKNRERKIEKKNNNSCKYINGIAKVFDEISMMAGVMCTRRFLRPKFVYYFMFSSCHIVRFYELQLCIVSERMILQNTIETLEKRELLSFFLLLYAFELQKIWDFFSAKQWRNETKSTKKEKSCS